MGMDIISGFSGPVSEVISQTIELIFEIVFCAKDVLIKKESFKELATYLERIVPILKELNNKTINDSESLNNAMDILSREIRAAKQFTLDCTNKNKFYLLMNCRAINKRLEDTTREISRALDLLPLASLDLSSAIFEEIRKLRETMQKAEFRAAVTEEEILEKIESGIQERNVGRSYANNLLFLIAKAVGVSTERSALKKEFEEFKDEIENARMNKDRAETIQMDQIIALLERADAASSPWETEKKYLSKRNSLGSQPLEPLHSFYCPITKEVMEDPVETSSGQTFERSAIEKWLAGENTFCPLTMIPLDKTVLWPNKTLRKSIEEWKDRNTLIRIASIKPKIMSGEEDVVLNCLELICDLCEQRELHREWVILENYIPILVRLLGAQNRDIRNRALVILWILTKDTDDAKERIANVDNAIESIVKSLGRRVGERKLAVSLLLELSKCDRVREYIGKVQGCILLLVTMSSSDDGEASREAQELLESLAFSDHYVIQMAKANYFKHFLQRLFTGPDDVKITMATTLAEMELTNHNKESLFEGGVLGPLLHLVSHGNIEIKKAAVNALQNLSSLPKIAQQMIREGASRHLLDLLFDRTSLFSGLRENVAATIMNLANSTVSQESSQTPVLLLESEDDIFRLFSLISLSRPDTQKILILTLHALCQSPSATNIKMMLIQSSGIEVLVELCERNDMHVRASAVKLFCCLAEYADEASIKDHISHRCIETLLRILKSSTDEEEITSAMGILSHLPETPQITKWLLDSGALPAIIKYLHNQNRNDCYRNELIENTVGALCRFTVPASLEWQKTTAEAGVIPILVHLLESGTTLTKKRAAISLSRFSESSVKLVKQIPKRKGFFCFSPPPETLCPVHNAICSVESSFCLVEADAVAPLVRNLGESDIGVCETSLDALLTLIEGERLQSGSKVLAEANAIPRIISFLGSPDSNLQEKALHALERIFRLVEFKQKYGGSAQVPLVDLTQRGNGHLKSLAARILAHLNVLHDQSSFF